MIRNNDASLLGYRGPPPRLAFNGLVRCLLDSLSPHRFSHYSYACTSAVRLLSSLHAARPSACLGDVTSYPQGMSRLVALLSVPDEAVRNGAVLLLLGFARGSALVRQFVSFDEGTERLLGAVHDEGGLCGGSPVARDCLALLACILREDGGRDMAASSRRAMDALVPLLEWWRSQAWRSGLPAEGSADEDDDDDDEINELIGDDKTDRIFPLSEVEEEMMTMVLSDVLVPLVSEGNGPHLHLQRGPVPAGGSRTEGPHRGVLHRPAGCGMSPKRWPPSPSAPLDTPACTGSSFSPPPPTWGPPPARAVLRRVLDDWGAGVHAARGQRERRAGGRASPPPPPMSCLLDEDESAHDAEARNVGIARRYATLEVLAERGGATPRRCCCGCAPRGSRSSMSRFRGSRSGSEGEAFRRGRWEEDGDVGEGDRERVRGLVVTCLGLWLEQLVSLSWGRSQYCVNRDASHSSADLIYVRALPPPYRAKWNMPDGPVTPYSTWCAPK